MQQALQTLDAARVTSPRTSEWPTYTGDKLTKASTSNYYIKIGRNAAGLPATSHLYLTGAVKRWEKDPSYVYSSEYRLAGPEADVRLYVSQEPYFTQQGITPEMVINASYRPDNYTQPGMTEMYQSEINTYKRLQRQINAQLPSLPLNQLKDLVEGLKSLRASQRQAGTGRGATRGRRRRTGDGRRLAGPRGPRTALRARVEEVVNGNEANPNNSKVIDVTKLTAEGTKARTILGTKAPKNIAFSPRLDVIVAQNTPEGRVGYQRALERLVQQGYITQGEMGELMNDFGPQIQPQFQQSQFQQSQFQRTQPQFQRTQPQFQQSVRGMQVNQPQPPSVSQRMTMGSTVPRTLGA